MQLCAKGRSGHCNPLYLLVREDPASFVSHFGTLIHLLKEPRPMSSLANFPTLSGVAGMKD